MVVAIFANGQDAGCGREGPARQRRGCEPSASGGLLSQSAVLEALPSPALCQSAPPAPLGLVTLTAGWGWGGAAR